MNRVVRPEHCDWRRAAEHYLEVMTDKQIDKTGLGDATAMLRTMLRDEAWNNYARWMILCDALDESDKEFWGHVARYIRSFDPICWTAKDDTGQTVSPGQETAGKAGGAVLP